MVCDRAGDDGACRLNITRQRRCENSVPKGDPKSSKIVRSPQRLAGHRMERRSTSEMLPALHDDVHILRVEFDKRARRPARSAAIMVVPDPPNRSSTMSRLFDEFRMARSTSSIGFIVGCKSFFAGLSMNQTSPWSRAPHQ